MKKDSKTAGCSETGNRVRKTGEIPVEVINLELACSIKRETVLRLLDILSGIKNGGDLFVPIYNSMRGFSDEIQEFMVEALDCYIMGESRVVTNIAQIDYALGVIYEEFDFNNKKV